MPPLGIHDTPEPPRWGVADSAQLREELIEALAEARDMPDGPAKLSELERIVANADAAGDTRLGFDARFELIATYNSHPQRWRMLPAVDWCLAAVDREPTLFSVRDATLLHRYHKWTVAAACGTPRIGLARTQTALDNLASRLHEAGQSLQAVYQLRCRIADHVGDIAAARQWLRRWRSAPPDETSDCAGCEPARQAALLAGWGEWDEAVRAVEPVLQGRISCVDQPERALGAVMVSYLHLGRFEEAAHAHVRAYRRHRRERDAFPLLAEHLRFCALTGHVARGLDILAKQLPCLDQPYDELSAMEFATAGALLCRLAAEGLGDRTIHRPARGDRPAADLPVGRLGATLRALARDLAGQFDARNGTNHQSGRMAAWLAARPLCAPFPLPDEEPGDESDDEPDVPGGLDEPDDVEEPAAQP